MGVSQINERQLNENLKEIINNAATKEELEEVKKSVSDGKELVANAITNKGIETATDATFATIATNIENIPILDTSDANAAAGDILSGKSAYVNGLKVNGNIPFKAAATIIPGTSNQTISAGQYLQDDQIILGDTNLLASNIKKGVSIFGVNGSMADSNINNILGKTLNLANSKIFNNTYTYSSSKYLFPYLAGQTFSLTASKEIVLVAVDVYGRFSSSYSGNGYTYLWFPTLNISGLAYRTSGDNSCPCASSIKIPSLFKSTGDYSGSSFTDGVYLDFALGSNSGIWMYSYTTTNPNALNEFKTHYNNSYDKRVITVSGNTMTYSSSYSLGYDSSDKNGIPVSTIGFYIYTL